MSGSKPSKSAGASRGTVLVALLAGLGLGAGMVALRDRDEQPARDALAEARGQRDAALIEAKEARIAFTALVRESARWRAKAADLTDRLAATDPGLPGTEARSAVSLEAIAKARVVKASEDLGSGYVVLDVGSRDGIRPGMSLSVVRDEKVIARLRVYEVRELKTGASVEEADAGVFPRAGDRIVLGTGSGA